MFFRVLTHRPLLATITVTAVAAQAAYAASDVSDAVIAEQRAALAAATKDAGFGPQAPRDLGTVTGENQRIFATAPAHTEMNLCNIHFHEGAEHKGGNFTTYAGNGDGKGYGTGFLYDGELTDAELAPLDAPIGDLAHGGLEPGDTIEIHFVHSSAKVTPGPTLGSCISEAIGNPQLRVETVVAVLVNDDAAADFTEMATISTDAGLAQVPNLPTDLGDPIVYAGSTTGPSFNEKGSPFQVTWSVRPDVVKLDIASVDAWFKDNVFDENAAHGVRNLVMNPALLSTIE
ncbi:delta-class carbonic anhydrase [Roseobacter cerasinus]|nr:delta-class carbonic anhydrase [Roseobacter cerasinus]